MIEIMMIWYDGVDDEGGGNDHDEDDTDNDTDNE